MKKILILTFILLLVGCAGPKIDQAINSQPINLENTKNTVLGQCVSGPVTLENYGDKGKRLASCFVEYPGEPTREDKSYYIVEDICGQFTKEFMENILGQQVVKVEAPKISGLYNCSYYLNDKDYIMLVLDYLSVADQKKGREFIGHKIMVDNRITMENFYAVQENGLINTVYLVLDPEKFISIERPNAKVLEGDLILQFAARLAEQIKNYK
ncbi:MAG: hypothetical protein NT116_04085 [Candidatus Parcubacteria bacterium]|nr:hypothetical protein [Candidatus Parcubacteria bacterium]